MKNVVKKLKLKGVVAWLLVCNIVVSTLVTSVGSVDVYADSKSRLTASIGLAEGQTLSSVDAAENIDESSLQVIALYLSNYYIPFVTVLDGDYNYEGAEDTGNIAHVQAMKNALTQNCGMTKQTAEFITNYVLSQSLNTCSQLYVTRGTLYELLRKHNSSVDTENEEEGKKEIISWAGFCTLPDYYCNYNESNNTLTYPNYGRGSSCDAGDTAIGYKLIAGDDKDGNEDIDKWIKRYTDHFGTVTDRDSNVYVPVTYPLFLALMQLSLDNNSEERISSGNTVNKATYNPQGKANGEHLFATFARTNFYCRDSAGNFSVVFSNSVACLESFLLATSEVPANKGYGTALAFVGDEDVEKIQATEESISIQGTAWGSLMYVNWEGSLIVDAGVYRTPVVPGCVNPHMLTTLDNTADNCYTVPLQNLFAMSSYISGYSTGSSLAIKTKGTLYDKSTWCVSLVDTSDKLDAGGKGTWGQNQYIHDLCTSSTFITAKEGKWDNDDSSTFPNFKHIDWLLEDIEGRDDYKWFRSSFDGYGAPTLNSSFVWRDDNSGINSSSELTDFFSTFDITSPEFVTKYNAENTSIYASFTDIRKLGTTGVYANLSPSLAKCLYWTYCFAKFNETSDTGIVDLKLNTSKFPAFNSNIDWSTLYADSLSDQVLSFTYYLLHPTEGISYVATLIKNKLGGFLIRCHEDMVGSTDSNVSVGATKYLGTSSYTTVPGLYDVPWIASLLDGYNTLIVYFIILMCLILLCYVLTGSMTIQRGVVGIIMFALLAFIPPLAINAVVNVANNTTDRVYSDKFDYWAITQLENYLITLDEVGKRDDSDISSYAAVVISNYTQATDSVGGSVATGYGGTKLKWMSPKKYNSMASLSKAMSSISESTDANFLLQSLFSSVAQATSGESFLDSDNALYLYRDYNDLYRASSYSYYVERIYNYNGALRDGNNISIGRDINKPLMMYIESGSNPYASYSYSWKDLPDSASNLAGLVTREFGKTENELMKSKNMYDLVSSTRAVDMGFLNDTLYTSEKDNRQYYLHSYNMPNNTLAVSYILNYNLVYRYTALSYEYLSEVADGTKTLDLSSIPNSNNKLSSGDNGFNFGSFYGSNTNNFYRYGTPEILGLAEEKSKANAFSGLSSYYYGLYSESPFYFFGYNTRDALTAYDPSFGFSDTDLANPKGSGLNKLASMFIQENQAYFYNMDDNSGSGFGELRDYMNMHDLFYYVIPYLKPGVDVARLYDNLFGLYMDDDVSLQFNETGSFVYDKESYSSLDNFSKKYRSLTDEQKYKFWHSYNTFTILQNYSSWVDTMYDCDYAKSETITVMDDKFRVDDPLDPFSYFKFDKKTGQIVEGRLMVFSRSEMSYYGLDMSDLTTVEKKIISLQDSVYESTLKLMNYYSLSDETLITSYALLQTFEFNSEFSQSKPLGNSYNLYPQGYELKAFSYDAYLRMIIAEASGEPIMTSTTDGGSNTSIYKRVLENTSIFFAVFLLLNDLLAVYLIPGLKLFFIVCIFFTSILIILASVIKMELNILKVMWKSLFAPLISFLAVSIGFSIIVSMFMGNGANGVLSSSAIINLGDPTSTIMVMIIVNAIVVILYFKICKKCFNDFKTYIKAVFDNIGSTLVGAVGAVTGAVAGGKATDRLLKKSGSDSGDGVANTPKQRGKDNMPSSGKNGVGSAIAAGVGVGAGGALAKDMLSDGEKRKLEKDNKRKDESVGMNKWDKKAYDGANKKADKEQAKLDKVTRKQEVAKNRYGEDSNKYKKLSKAKDKQSSRVVKRERNATDIAKYGKVGATKKHIKDSVTSGSVAYKAGRVVSAPKRAANGVGRKVSSIKKGASQVGSKAASSAKRAGRSTVKVAKKQGSSFKKGLKS